MSEKQTDIDNGMMNAPMMTVPRPDPTTLTTQQLEKGIASVREILETRLSGNAEAVKLLKEERDKLPEYIRELVGHLQQLQNEKFAGVGQRLVDLVTQTDKVAALNQTAIAAALLAAKELVSIQNTSNTNAIDKSSAAFTKQIENIVLLIGTNTKSQDDKYNDLKDRLTALEAIKKGTNEGLGMAGSIVLGVAVLIGVVISFAALFLPYMRSGG